MPTIWVLATLLTWAIEPPAFIRDIIDTLYPHQVIELDYPIAIRRRYAVVKIHYVFFPKY
jgi:hypothetical protein